MIQNDKSQVKAFLLSLIDQIENYIYQNNNPDNKELLAFLNDKKETKESGFYLIYQKVLRQSFEIILSVMKDEIKNENSLEEKNNYLVFNNDLLTYCMNCLTGIEVKSLFINN